MCREESVSCGGNKRVGNGLCKVELTATFQFPAVNLWWTDELTADARIKLSKVWMKKEKLPETCFSFSRSL